MLSPWRCTMRMDIPCSYFDWMHNYGKHFSEQKTKIPRGKEDIIENLEIIELYTDDEDDDCQIVEVDSHLSPAEDVCFDGTFDIQDTCDLHGIEQKDEPQDININDVRILSKTETVKNKITILHDVVLKSPTIYNSNVNIRKEEKTELNHKSEHSDSKPNNSHFEVEFFPTDDPSEESPLILKKTVTLNNVIRKKKKKKRRLCLIKKQKQFETVQLLEGHSTNQLPFKKRKAHNEINNTFIEETNEVAKPVIYNTKLNGVPITNQEELKERQLNNVVANVLRDAVKVPLLEEPKAEIKTCDLQGQIIESQPQHNDYNFKTPIKEVQKANEKRGRGRPRKNDISVTEECQSLEYVENAFESANLKKKIEAGEIETIPLVNREQRGRPKKMLIQERCKEIKLPNCQHTNTAVYFCNTLTESDIKHFQQMFYTHKTEKGRKKFVSKYCFVRRYLSKMLALLCYVRKFDGNMTRVCLRTFLNVLNISESMVRYAVIDQLPRDGIDSESETKIKYFIGSLKGQGGHSCEGRYRKHLGKDWDILRLWKMYNDRVSVKIDEEDFKKHVSDKRFVMFESEDCCGVCGWARRT